MTGYPDTAMFDGIEKVQKDNGLFPDRSMRPGGETETTINRQLKNNIGVGRLTSDAQQPGRENDRSAQFPNNQAPQMKKNYTREDELKLNQLRRRKIEVADELNRLQIQYGGARTQAEIDFYNNQKKILHNELQEIQRQIDEIIMRTKIRI